jgi:hypothetical protein
MSDSELAVVSVDSFAAPALITRASPSARKKFFEFFTVPIRNYQHPSRLLQGNPAIISPSRSRHQAQLRPNREHFYACEFSVFISY